MNNMNEKVKELESWRHVQDTNNAVNKQSLLSIEKRLDRIDGHMTRLVWTIVGSILLGFLTFIMQGGLNVSA